MKKFKWIFFLLLCNFALSGAINAQNGTVSANVRIKLVKALEVQKVHGDLYFGELVLTGASAKVEKTPDQGVLFQISGQPGKNVTIDFGSPLLTAENSNKNLEFIPTVNHTGNNSQYVNPITVIKGTSYKLVNNQGTGSLYLWVGGEIDVDGTMPYGDYSGQFPVTVSY